MNRHIVIAVIVIAGLSVWHHYAFIDVEPKDRTTTSITVGAFLFLGVLSLLDLVPGLSELAGSLAMLAMLTVILNDLPGLLENIQFGGDSEARSPSAQDVFPSSIRSSTRGHPF